MKYLFFLIMITSLMSCVNNQTINETTTNDKMELFTENARVVQGYIDAFCNEDSAAVAVFLSDTVVRIAPGYGDTSTSKAYWLASAKVFYSVFDHAKVNNPIYIPTVDPITMKPDGNVSAYAHWTDELSNGLKVDFKWHGLFKINTDHKIVYADEYLDLGGMLNAINTLPK
jgi:hypothetical protein